MDDVIPAATAPLSRLLLLFSTLLLLLARLDADPELPAGLPLLVGGKLRRLPPCCLPENDKTPALCEAVCNSCKAVGDRSAVPAGLETAVMNMLQGRWGTGA